MRPVVLYSVPAAVRPAREFQRARRRQLFASALMVAVGLVLAGVLVAVN